jgi:hypothetical protein
MMELNVCVITEDVLQTENFFLFLFLLGETQNPTVDFSSPIIVAVPICSYNFDPRVKL